MIEIKLNVSEIPKDKIFTGAKGKYLDIQVAKMKAPDAYGNDYTVYIYDKEKKEKLYIGKGKGKFEDAAPTQPISYVPQQNNNEIDDMPF